MYGPRQIENIREVIESKLGLYNVEFEKEVQEDLYYISSDNKGVRDRIRVKPQLGTAFIWEQAEWKQIRGFKFE